MFAYSTDMHLSHFSWVLKFDYGHQFMNPTYSIWQFSMMMLLSNTLNHCPTFFSTQKAHWIILCYNSKSVHSAKTKTLHDLKIIFYLSIYGIISPHVPMTIHTHSNLAPNSLTFPRSHRLAVMLKCLSRLLLTIILCSKFYAMSNSNSSTIPSDMMAVHLNVLQMVTRCLPQVLEAEKEDGSQGCCATDHSDLEGSSSCVAELICVLLWAYLNS
jgi:hypothetical protein